MLGRAAVCVVISSRTLEAHRVVWWEGAAERWPSFDACVCAGRSEHHASTKGQLARTRLEHASISEQRVGIGRVVMRGRCLQCSLLLQVPS